MEIHLWIAAVEFSRSPRASVEVMAVRRTIVRSPRDRGWKLRGLLVFWLVDDRETVRLPERAGAPQWRVERALSTHSGGTAVD